MPTSLNVKIDMDVAILMLGILLILRPFDKY